MAVSGLRRRAPLPKSLLGTVAARTPSHMCSMPYRHYVLHAEWVRSRGWKILVVEISALCVHADSNRTGRALALPAQDGGAHSGEDGSVTRTSISTYSAVHILPEISCAKTLHMPDESNDSGRVTRAPHPVR